MSILETGIKGNSRVYRLRRLSSLCLLTIVFSSAQAQDERWYEVEVLVFSQVSTKSYDSEKWPINLNSKFPADTIELKPYKIKPPLPDSIESTIPEMPEAFTLIDPNEYQLQKIPAKLVETSGYEVLVHRTWRQPLIKNEKGISVLIDDEDSLNAYQEFSINEQWFDAELLEEQSILGEETPVALDIDSMNEFGATQIQPLIVEDDPIDLDWGFNAFQETGFDIEKTVTARPLMGPEQLRTYGTVTLKMSRFLHLSLDMFFRTQRPKIVVPEGLLASDFPMDAIDKNKATDETEKASDEFKNTLELEPVDFRLSDSQRIKTKEIYYFDHPLFGVLTMVTPIEVPEEEEPLN
ncbi:MAG: peptidoglycan binding protein CsiV [Gammaproteobacteria bacterium]|nr:peptidoglycan binding protein CsiV [Gammaproteobacteria bacterium]